ncbi:hypothetical protein A0H81_13491 [Grifola frondosa]|uniref:Uncharacterized protein n=1 Tax=Grifola frondosa TaxID=5627 RepID=A0A1C7LRH3_GRIFR|nr:hypothetical protein A0H81_13491 [Grifola frondosa]
MPNRGSGRTIILSTHIEAPISYNRRSARPRLHSNTWIEEIVSVRKRDALCDPSFLLSGAYPEGKVIHTP